MIGNSETCAACKCKRHCEDFVMPNSTVASVTLWIISAGNAGEESGGFSDEKRTKSSNKKEFQTSETSSPDHRRDGCRQGLICKAVGK